MESSEVAQQSSILVFLFCLAVLSCVSAWLFPERAQDILDSVINQRLGLGLQIPFGPKDRYNIRGTQLTEKQPLTSGSYHDFPRSHDSHDPRDPRDSREATTS